MVENNLRNNFIKPQRGDRSVILNLLSEGHPYGILCFGLVFFLPKGCPYGTKSISYSMLPQELIDN
jgi:hypothetical protein